MPIRKPVDLSSRSLRSALTNGTSIFGRNIDHRGPRVRRLRDLLHLHQSDAGGISNISENEKSLIRRASVIELQLEIMEERFMQHDREVSVFQLETYQRLANTLRRLLQTIGMKRVPKDITPTVSEYLRSKQKQIEATEASG
jgi:hypothetical protein